MAKYRKLKEEIRRQSIYQEFISDQLPSCIILKLLVKASFTSYSLLLKFIQAFYTDRTIYTKDTLSILGNGAFDDIFKFLFCFHTISILLLLVSAPTVCSYSYVSQPQPALVCRKFIIWERFLNGYIR